MIKSSMRNKCSIEKITNVIHQFFFISMELIESVSDIGRTITRSFFCAVSDVKIEKD